MKIRMNRQFSFWIMVGVWMMLGGCSSDLTPQEYKTYLYDLDNGCRIIKNYSTIQLDIQYWPPEAEAIRLRKSNVKEQDRMRYFQVNIKPQKTAELSQNRHYWAFGMQQDLWLETPQGKLPCVLFHSEKGITEEAYTCLVGFEVDEKLEEAGTFFFLSTELGIGPLRFTPDCQPPPLKEGDL